MLPDREPLRLGWHCKCPKCAQGDLYKPGITLDLRDKCEICGLDLSKNDSADGPAVFLIFILGFALVPAALILDAWLQPPLWIHALLWGVIAIGATIGMLRPLKAYIIALQYKHRATDWE
ncbi:MAG: DUF983 domain-containing protein [Alphaproteobacteria bacterium]|jgi:uncharacterized protein (DUF983 family)|nr:DUF983 domain-containing protein [Alphaproteobacteria bacterium]